MATARPNQSVLPIPPPPRPPNTDIYDEEFYNNLQLAKSLIEKLNNKRDKQICKKWIGKLCNLKSEDAVVKKNRNAFFQYMLHILTKATQDNANIAFDTEEGKKPPASQYMCKWSPDRRTYIAAQPLPGEGALIYMAVSKDPSLGWERP